MKIGLFGYGKMGQLLDKLATEQGDEIVARIDGPDSDPPLDQMDVAIDFSLPESAFDNISLCLKAGVPVVSGTTGWLDRYEEAVALCGETGGALLYASNFSLGVNLFFALNEQLARLMQNAPGYAVHLEETHHIHKLDAPSGTAITLAEGVVENSDYPAWKPEEAPGLGLPIRSIREGEVPGTHVVSWSSPVDRIDITHTAHNREGFARGALFAASWLVGKQGVFSMKDVLNLR
ncbi:dihydrodipicolinate reductase [Robiginitalea myxolifaciens]|uniref:4-hydroxy-tetrahydrodipicolinate reductase n=1 Tax=Robiginitalea myxolifaciens TaxID=400055 RepID=A0A1I6FNA7_9FLAO|nr:4-hydroxy-tetrahydrodipicolinate reductase [Robiginitalea myxolifaciens]SFR31416.1 dihydrodipicolinate reductase [Robiginitalea myxolifaciens]